MYTCVKVYMYIYIYMHISIYVSYVSFVYMYMHICIFVYKHLPAVQLGRLQPDGPATSEVASLHFGVLPPEAQKFAQMRSSASACI